jgi:8-amino-7-oxononanoate synthase
MLERIAARLCALREADQLRELALPAGIPLSSNDYLGFATHPRLKQAIARAIEQDGKVASSGSRLLSGNHARWEQLESQFADFIGVEAALYFPSGYAANVGLLSSILKPGDTVFSDSANHASVIDGIRLSNVDKVVFPHRDLNYLEHAMRSQNSSGEKVVVVESIFSMDGDRAPMCDLVGLCERFGASLIVDEAHATGVVGVGGRGLVHAAGRPSHVLATVHTCGKAMASMGAFVAGSRELRDFLINHARPFIFTTALPPYCAAQVSEAVVLVSQAEAERARLQQLSEYLRTRMRAEGLSAGRSESQIVPLILGSNDTALRLASALVAAGFAVRAIRPPTVPPGSARLRFSLNASLSIADIDALMEVLTAVGTSWRGGL